MVVGGPRIMTELLQHRLLDHFIITLEPYLFGEGVTFMELLPLDCVLQLTACEKINERGTLALQYKVMD